MVVLVVIQVVVRVVVRLVVRVAFWVVLVPMACVHRRATPWGVEATTCCPLSPMPGGTATPGGSKLTDSSSFWLDRAACPPSAGVTRRRRLISTAFIPMAVSCSSSTSISSHGFVTPSLMSASWYLVNWLRAQNPASGPVGSIRKVVVPSVSCWLKQRMHKKACTARHGCTAKPGDEESALGKGG